MYTRAPFAPRRAGLADGSTSPYAVSPRDFPRCALDEHRAAPRSAVEILRAAAAQVRSRVPSPLPPVSPRPVPAPTPIRVEGELKAGPGGLALRGSIQSPSAGVPIAAAAGLVFGIAGTLIATRGR
jgi:hypothetical protein